MIKLDKKKSHEIVENCSLGIVKSYNIEGCNYYVKSDDDLKEVIGFYLATYLELNSIEYVGIKIKGHFYSFSRDINELYDFKEANRYYIPLAACELLKIIDCISKVSNNPNLTIDILKMYVFDILFLNDDRHACNWGLINENELVLFDNFNIFSIYNPPYINYNHELFISNNKIRLCNSIYSDFEEFLNNCDEEILEIIYKMVNKASLENIKAIFELIEKKYQIKINDRFIRIYEPHYKKILEIINRKRGINNAR